MDNKIELKLEETYRTKIEPNIQKYEYYRIEAKKKHDIYKKAAQVLVLIAIVALIFVLSKFFIKISVSLFTLFLIFGCFLITKAEKIENDFRKKIKPVLLSPILSLFGNFNIVNDEVISLKEIQDMGLFRKAERKTDDDIIFGTYKDIPVTLIETRLTHTRSSGKSRSTVQDFGGLILKIKMNKKFEGTTVASYNINIEEYIKSIEKISKSNPDMISLKKAVQILENPFVKTLLKASTFFEMNIEKGSLAIKMFDKDKNRKVVKKLEKVILEDIEFSKSYNIFSDNQVEARYLITTSFMERIKNIQTVFLALGAHFIFREEFLYLFLDGATALQDVRFGYFEIGSINETLFQKEKYYKVLNELKEIFSLVYYFKLNEKIGL